MADHSLIEWTDATWNPITGCSVVSPGCTNCYAMRLAGTRLKHHPSRAGLTIGTKAGPVWNGEGRLNEQWLDQPLRWSKSRMIFVCAHGDLFAEGVPDGWIMRVLDVMAQAQRHTFQVLTKRPDRMLDFFRRWADVNAEQDLDFKGARGPAEVRAAHPSGRGQLFADMLDAMGSPPAGCAYPLFDWAGGMARWPDFFRNIWLGVSVEDQTRADQRRAAMAALADKGWLTWVSYEPALGPVDWKGWEFARWIVSGGESGDGARPTHPEWHRATRDFCAAHEIAFLFKQWGAWPAFYDRDVDDPDWRSTPKVDGQMGLGATRFHNLAGGIGFHGERLVAVRNVGKKAAGRLLDGIEHNGLPRVRP